MSTRMPEYRRPIGAVPLLACALALAGPGGAVAGTAEVNAEIDALRKTVNDLVYRVKDLERQLASRPPAAVAGPPAKRVPQAQPVPRAPVADNVPKAAGPGAIAVDALAAERALERTLTAEGALLLPPKQVDLEPYFNYVRREDVQPRLVIADGSIGVRDLTIKRNEFDVGLRALVGLPFSSQLELDFPYRWVNRSAVAPVGIAGTAEQSDTGSSVGDIKIGLATTLLREHAWVPDLIGRITWDTDTGDQADNGVPLGIGYNELRLGFTALKRQDPLAFTAALSYTTAFEKDNVKPGDEVGLILGVSLAASPDTSLSLSLLQNFTQELEIDGQRVAGSDQVSAVLALGASAIVGRRTLASVTVGMGLTDDAPDYLINFSLPMRF